MKKNIIYITIFLIGISFSVLLGSSYIGDIHAGGTNTYNAVLSGDGTRLAVIDTRTGHVKIFDVDAGYEIKAFDKDERMLTEYQKYGR